jgi:hypothetical protein
MRTLRWVVLLVVALLVGGTLIVRRVWLGEVPTQGQVLHVDSYPPDAEVYISNVLSGTTPCQLPLLSGEYEVTLVKEHYLPWRQDVCIQAGQSLRLEAHLSLVPYVTLLADESAYGLVWGDHGFLYYLTFRDGELQPRQVQLEGSGATEAFALPADGAQYEYFWEPHGKTVLVRYADPASAHRSCQSYTLNGGRWRDLSSANSALLEAADVAWSADARQLAYLLPADTEPGGEQGYYEGPEPNVLWICAADGSKAREISLWDNASRVVWSPQGDRLVVESWTLGLEENRIWLVWPEDGTREELLVLGAHGAAWSDDGEWLAMRALGPPDAIAEGLWVVDKNGALLQRVGPDVPQEYRWLPGTHQLMYFASRPNQGGSSCWVVDVDSGSRVLLADAAVLGRDVGEFAVAPDGKKVAFVGADGRLYLLVVAD